MEEAETMGLDFHRSQIKGDTSTSVLLTDMILADSYIALDKPDKALVTYDSILKEHPNYGFALNNRAVLNFQQKNFPEAIEDFETQLTISPDNAKTLTIKARAHRELEQLDKADKDLKKAENIAPANPKIQKEQQVVDSLKVEKIKDKKEATKKIKSNKNDVQAYNQRAAANYSLGDNEAAIRDGQKALKLDKNNPEAYNIILETYLKEKDTINVKKIINELTRKDIDLNKEKRVKPLTEHFIKVQRSYHTNKKSN